MTQAMFCDKFWDKKCLLNCIPDLQDVSLLAHGLPFRAGRLPGRVGLAADPDVDLSHFLPQLMQFLDHIGRQDILVSIKVSKDNYGVEPRLKL